MNKNLLHQLCRALYVCCIMLYLPGAMHAQHRKASVLFIGNSYTSWYGLPQIVANIAASTGDTLEFDISAPGGATYADHINPAYTTIHTLKKLRAGGWDYVVLQEQSMGCTMEPYRYYPSSFAFGRRLVDSVRRYNPCAEIIFYMTWGRKKGFPGECAYTPWPYNCTYTTMDSVIRARYLEITYFTKSAVSPVGALWRYIRNNYPAIELYETDDSHPSAAGSYAGACSFYTTIFKKPAGISNYDFSLPAEIAASIRKAAGKVVYDSLQTWRIGKSKTIAGFSHKAQGTQLISLTNKSANASQYKWDFGDAQSSTAVNPTHTYGVPGIYTIQLIATGRSCSDTVYARVNTTDDTDAERFVIMPNPVRDKLYIRSDLFGENQYRLQLLNNRGQLVREQRATGAATQSINVAGLASGMYTLSIAATRRVYRKKIIILP